jgi:hypothetical protein
MAVLHCRADWLRADLNLVLVHPQIPQVLETCQTFADRGVLVRHLKLAVCRMQVPLHAHVQPQL